MKRLLSAVAILLICHSSKSQLAKGNWLAGGTGSLSSTKNKAQVTTTGGGYTNVNRFEIGPFVRYYFLDKENQCNILSEANYQWGIYSFKPDKGNSNTLSVLAGPVIYFNTVVGLEFLLGYYKRNEKVNGSFETEQKGLQIAIGFQIHLEKE